MCIIMDKAKSCRFQFKLGQVLHTCKSRESWSGEGERSKRSDTWCRCARESSGSVHAVQVASTGTHPSELVYLVYAGGRVASDAQSHWNWKADACAVRMACILHILRELHGKKEKSCNIKGIRILNSKAVITSSFGSRHIYPFLDKTNNVTSPPDFSKFQCDHSSFL